MIKSLPVNLELNTEVVYVGESFSVTAKIPKKLQLYSDSWQGGAEYPKTFEDGDYYLSKAIFTPKSTGFLPITYRMEQKLEDGTTKYMGEAKVTVLVVEPDMVNAGVEILPLDSSVSLDNGGQAVLIARIPLKYANQGYSGGWDSNVEAFWGPNTTDGEYSYSTAIFKPKKRGTYQIRFTAMAQGEWYASYSMTIKVVD